MNTDVLFHGSDKKHIRELEIIKRELSFIGVSVKEQLSDVEHLKRWMLDWEGQEAELWWSNKNGWDVDPVEGETLGSNWRNFSIDSYLRGRGVNTYLWYCED